MKRRELSHDFETFSEADLPSVGASRYARHPSTEVLMCAYAFDDGPVKQWVPVEGEKMPAELEDGLLDERVTKLAWNKPFEEQIWRHVEGIEIPHDQWRDPMILAYALALPGKLEKACPVVNLPLEYQKATNGKALINWFSKLRPATQRLPVRRVHWHEKLDKWEEFKAYNIQDVEAERAFWHRMQPYNLPEEEWQLWVLDQEINQAGIPINLEFATHADQVKDGLIEVRLQRMAQLTGLDNPNSPKQLLPWLQEEGYPFDDLKKGHVRRYTEDLRQEIEATGSNSLSRLLTVLELRLEVSQAAVKKFGALVSHTDDDGCLRDTLQFCGAGRTGRSAGRVFQSQNLVKPKKEFEGLEWETHPDGVQEVVGGPLIECVKTVSALDAEDLDLIYANPMDMLSASVRPTVQAPDGYLLLDADLKAIENVVIGWLANDQKILNVFREGRDPYISFGTYMVHRTYDDLWHEYSVLKNKAVRNLSKPPVLGCGFGLSAGHEYENKKTGEIEATGLLGYARNMNVEMTVEQAERAVSVWRDTYHDVVSLWYETEKAAFRCVRTGEPQRAGRVIFDRKGPFLRMILPSERPLYYCRPRLEMRETPWGEERLQLTYEGLDDKNQWARLKTYGSKLVENGTQAVARDLLFWGIRQAKRRGIDIRMHIHDQIVALALVGKAREALKVLISCMTELPEWAGDMPVGAAGHISKWFVKD